MPRHLSAPRHNPLGSKTSSLPEWVVSGLTKIAGGGSLDVLSGMQCSVNVQHTLPLPLEVHHVKFTFCIKCLVEDGTLDMHTRNATHVASNGNLIFMTCIPQNHKISHVRGGFKVVNQYSKVSILDDGEVAIEPVQSVSRCMHWLMMEQKEFEEFVKKGKLYINMLMYISRLD